MNAVRCVASIIFDELTGSKEECEVLIIIEAPHSMRTGRLKHIDELYLSHQDKVALEDFVNQSLEVFLFIDT